jgi:ferredoxin
MPHGWDTLSAVTDLLERTVGSLTVQIDRTTCIGTANCAKVAPELFVLDDERIIRFRESAGEVPADRVVEACDVCPVDALSAFNEDGRRLVP